MEKSLGRARGPPVAASSGESLTPRAAAVDQQPVRSESGLSRPRLPRAERKVLAARGRFQVAEMKA